MNFSGSQDKDNVRGGFFKCLEQGIGGFFSEHVDFIYNIDLVAGLIGGIIHPLPKVSDLVNATITSSINLNYIQSPSLGYCLAHRAGIAWLTLTVIGKAVHCLSQDAPGASLTCSPGPTKKIGMRYPTTTKGIA